MFKNLLLISVYMAPLGHAMSYRATTYDDFNISGATLHLWSYTYAPSGTSVIHTYYSSLSITLPSRNSASNAARGSGLTPAQADVYITMQSNDLNYDGIAGITAQHEAWCPYLGGSPFLSVGLELPDAIAIKLTTVNTYGYEYVVPCWECYTTAKCWNTETPACGSGGVICTSCFGTCSDWYLVGFWAVRAITSNLWQCSIGIDKTIPPPSIGAGYCSPA